MDELSVLTIDDSNMIRMSIANFLEDSGYIVYQAEDGEKGIELIKEKNPDIILTDMHMPGISGLDILNFIRENYEETPVIVISGAGEINYVVEALRLGAWDYLTKPIEDMTFLEYSLNKVIKKVNLIKENASRAREIKLKNIELEKTISELKTTQSRLVESEKMAALGYMVTGIAHEINTPVGVGVTSISYIQDETKAIMKLFKDNKMKVNDFKQFTDIISSAGEMIHNSFTKIEKLVMDFKQLSVDQQSIEKKSFLVKQNFLNTIKTITTLYKEPIIHVTLNGDETLVINSFPEVYTRILSKLLQNSILHGFRDRTDNKVTIEFFHDDQDKFNIIYKDNGSGIEKKILTKVFEPFVTTNKNIGPGLGLCIVYNLVTQKLNGTVNCENIDDSGVLFSIIIPERNI